METYFTLVSTLHLTFSCMLDVSPCQHTQSCLLPFSGCKYSIEWTCHILLSLSSLDGHQVVSSLRLMLGRMQHTIYIFIYMC